MVDQSVAEFTGEEQAGEALLPVDYSKLTKKLLLEKIEQLTTTDTGKMVAELEAMHVQVDDLREANEKLGEENELGDKQIEELRTVMEGAQKLGIAVRDMKLRKTLPDVDFNKTHCILKARYVEGQPPRAGKMRVRISEGNYVIVKWVAGYTAMNDIDLAKKIVRDGKVSCEVNYPEAQPEADIVMIPDVA